MIQLREQMIRASEVRRLKPEHIDRLRILIKVESGEGDKDRYTLLSEKLLPNCLIITKNTRLKLFCFHHHRFQ